jgi:hypothetical protein
MAARVLGLGHGLDGHQIGMPAQALAGGHGQPSCTVPDTYSAPTWRMAACMSTTERIHPVVHAQRGAQGVHVPVAIGSSGWAGSSVGVTGWRWPFLFTA